MNNARSSGLVALFASIVLLGVSTAHAGPALSRLPDFSLPDLEGKLHAASEFSGKVVVMDFWATWCATCKETIPKLAELHKTHKDKGLVILGVSVDKGSDRKIERTGERLGVNYLVLRDKENQWADTFGFKGIPSVYVFGRDGKLLLALPGYDADQEKLLLEAVAKALNGSK